MASTNTDFRLAIGLFDHPKMVKLEMRLGKAGQIALLRLWEFTTINRPDGTLTSMDVDDIAIAAKWAGDSEQFVTTLLSLRWLDEREDGVIVVHDWQENNPWAAGAIERSDKSKHAALVLHHGKEAADHWRETGELPEAPKRARNVAETGGTGSKTSGLHAGSMPDSASSMPVASDGHCCKHDLAVPLSYPILSDSSPTPKDPPKAPQGASDELVDADEEELADEGDACRFDPKEHFAVFYASYPNKKARDAAERKFCTKVRSQETFDAVMAGLQRAKRSDDWTKDGGKYIPHPSTWLNQGRWKDEVANVDVSTGTVYLPDGRMYVDGREVDVQAMLQAGRTPISPPVDEPRQPRRRPCEIPGFRHIGRPADYSKTLAELGQEHMARHGH